MEWILEYIFIALSLHGINYYYCSLISHTITANSAIVTILWLLIDLFYDLTNIADVSHINIKIEEQSSITQRAPKYQNKKFY